MPAPEPIRTRKPRGAILKQFQAITGTLADPEKLVGTTVKVRVTKKSPPKMKAIEVVALKPKRVNAGITREAWMLKAVDALRADFVKADAAVGPVRVSIGWPGGRGNKQHVIGQCWAASAVGDKQPAIFVSPVLEDPVDILVTILHEMVHATGAFHHRAAFAKVAGKVGLTAPWTSTPASEPLKAAMAKLATKLGPFPHSKVRGEGGLLGVGPERPPVQGTRMLKVVCPEDGYLVRTTAKWLAVGLPSCPDGHGMVAETGKEPEGE